MLELRSRTQLWQQTDWRIIKLADLQIAGYLAELEDRECARMAGEEERTRRWLTL